MASGSAIVKLSLVAAFVCVVFGGRVGEAISCGTVLSNLAPCLSFLMNGGSVPDNCCTGVRSVNSMAQTSFDRQSVCTCLKSFINGYTYNSSNVAHAASLPSKCGINTPYPISPNTDCSTVRK